MLAVKAYSTGPGSHVLAIARAQCGKDSICHLIRGYLVCSEVQYLWATTVCHFSEYLSVTPAQMSETLQYLAVRLLLCRVPLVAGANAL